MNESANFVGYAHLIKRFTNLIFRVSDLHDGFVSEKPELIIEACDDIDEMVNFIIREFVPRNAYSPNYRDMPLGLCAVPLKLLTAVAYIGVDFGHGEGEYELEQHFIDEARVIHANAIDNKKPR